MFAYCENNPAIASDNNGHKCVCVAVSDGGGTADSNKPSPFLKLIRFFFGTCAIKLDVPLYKQTGNNCGSFCETMVIAYQNGVDYGQEKAAEISEDRCQKITKNPHGAIWPTNAQKNTRVPHSMEAIFYYMVTTNQPLYANYRNKSKDDAGHLVVITGVDLEKGIIYTNNPWGIQGAQSFNEFLNGFAGAGKGWRLTSITRPDE